MMRVVYPFDSKDIAHVLRYRSEKVRTVASPVVISVNKSHDTKLLLKGVTVCDLCRLHHSFNLQSIKNSF